MKRYGFQAEHSGDHHDGGLEKDFVTSLHCWGKPHVCVDCVFPIRRSCWECVKLEQRFSIPFAVPSCFAGGWSEGHPDKIRKGVSVAHVYFEVGTDQVGVSVLCIMN